MPDNAPDSPPSPAAAPISPAVSSHAPLSETERQELARMFPHLDWLRRYEATVRTLQEENEAMRERADLPKILAGVRRNFATAERFFGVGVDVEKVVRYVMSHYPARLDGIIRPAALSSKTETPNADV